MRLAGTINRKSGAWARVLEADIALEPYPIETLVGDLPGPPTGTARTTRHGDRHDEPYKRIPPPEYFRADGRYRHPAGRPDLLSRPPARRPAPSCSVGRSAEQGWCCHSAGFGARGTIYDLASVLGSGPWGQNLRGETFARAHARVMPAFPEIHDGQTAHGVGRS